jgi:hypothetical protein
MPSDSPKRPANRCQRHSADRRHAAGVSVLVFLRQCGRACAGPPTQITKTPTAPIQPRRTVISLGLGDDLRSIPATSLAVRHCARPRKYETRPYEAWYITTGTPYLVLSSSSQRLLFRLIVVRPAPLYLHKEGLQHTCPGSPPWVSHFRSSGQHQSSTPTTRRLDRFLSSIPSTSMDECSSSRTWVSSSLSGHGKLLHPTSRTIIAYSSRYAFPPLVSHHIRRHMMRDRN